MSDIQEAEIRVFLDAVRRYFGGLTREQPNVRGAYLAPNQSRPISQGYTGLITVSGGYRGCVYVTAPRAMLRRLLMAIQSTDHSEENLLDTVGEIANTIAGNARSHFGETMEISVPVTISGTPEQIRPRCRTQPYVVVIDWNGYAASLVVDITPA